MKLRLTQIDFSEPIVDYYGSGILMTPLTYSEDFAFIFHII